MGEMSMVERVARAICATAGRNPDDSFVDRHGKQMDFPEWERWRAEARAAIEAMREPSEAMWKTAEYKHDCYGDSMIDIYRTMIDAALSPKPEREG